MAAVVAIKSRVSGAVVDHFYHQSIAAFDAVTLIRERKWHRVPVDDGYVEFQNDASHKRLGVSLGRHAQADDTTGGTCRVQWKEIDTGDGHFLLQNRATGDLLCFEDNACIKLAPSTHEARLDHANHWSFVWLTEPQRDSTVAIRSTLSGNVLDHYYEKSIAALETDAVYDERRWYRVPVAARYVVYRNVRSGKLLTHLMGLSIEAAGTALTDLNVQWKEIPVAHGQFVLENRATRALLRLVAGDNITAVVTSHVNGFSDQHNVWSFLSIEGTPNLPTWRNHTIVILKNRESDTVLQHHCGEHIAAYDDDTDHPNSQWYRILLGGGFVTYKNVATGKVLQHFQGEIVNANSNDDNESKPSEACQWQEIDLGGGFFAIQNRPSQALLRFESRDWITAAVDELSGGRSDHLSQWSFVEV